MTKQRKDVEKDIEFFPSKELEAEINERSSSKASLEAKAHRGGGLSKSEHVKGSSSKTSKKK